MMHALACEHANISFEGQLSHTELPQIPGARFEETQVLRRGTLQPILDFIVLPLTSLSLPLIETAVISKIAFKGNTGIVHVQIETGGTMAFAAYDQFDRDCVVAYPAVPAALLMKLVEERVLYSFRPI